MRAIRGDVGVVVAGLALLLVLVLSPPQARASEGRSLKGLTGAETGGIVALAEGSQCHSIAASPAGTIEWGDGTSSPPAAFEPVGGGGAWEVLGKHVYGKPGLYTGTFSGTYKCNGSNAAFTPTTFTAEVTTRISATAGVAFSGELAGVPIRSSESGDCAGASNEISGTISWGDGGSSELGRSEFVTTGELMLRLGGAHTYSSPGSYEGTISGVYKCFHGTFRSYEAKFSALVKAAAPPEGTPTPTGPTTSPTTPPPPAPPPVKAAFGVTSVTPGTAVLNAAASAPTGSTAARYSWNVTGGSQPDAVCQGSEPQLTVKTGAALDTTVTLTAVDAATGQSTVASRHLTIAAPAKPALAGKLARAGELARAGKLARAASAPVSLKGAVTPSFKIIGTCTGAGLPFSPSTSYRAALNTGAAAGLVRPLGGQPPASCLEETQFGAADIEGCLGEVPSIDEIPGSLTIGLASLLCGAKQQAYCEPALSSLSGAAVASVAAARAGSRDPLAHSALTVPAAVGAVGKSLAGMNFPIYFSTAPIRINGLDIDPEGSTPLVIVPGADLVLGLNVRVYLHNFPLVQLPALVLHLPDLGGKMGELSLPKSVPVIGSLPFNGSIGIELHRAGTKLANGDTCAFDCAALSAHLELPGVFSNGRGEGVSGGAVLTADNEEGLQLSSFELSIPEAQLGGIGVKEVLFRYLHANDSLHGGATLDLGPVGDIGATIDFIHGHFNGASLQYSAGTGPGIDLGGPIPIFLTELGGGFTIEPPVVEANAAIAGGPNVLGCPLFGIQAEAVVHFEPEFALDANGTGDFLCQSVASEYFHLDGAGHIGLGATLHIHFLIFAVEGGFNFEVDTAQGHFQADGNVNACLELFGGYCLGAEAVVSDRGIGVCADLGFTHAGGGIQFPDTALVFFDSCDIGKFRSLGFTTGRRGRAASGQTVTVPRGQKVAVLGFPGSGAAPLLTLTGPSGRTIATPANGFEKTPADVVIADNHSATKETYFFIDHPEAGAWKVALQPGSAPVTSIEQAASLPAPDVKGRVSRAGSRERLRYSLASIPGQQVTFAERQANGNFRVIGKAKGGRGVLLFAPSPQLARERTIEAMVSQDGTPREDAVVAHFTVSPPAALPAPSHLRIVRRGGALAISFRPVAGALGYGLAVRLSDGRSLYLKLPAARHGTKIPSVASNIAAKVAVGAIVPGPRLREGRVAQARLKAGHQPAKTVVVPLRS